jgi:hypothetical protein
MARTLESKVHALVFTVPFTLFMDTDGFNHRTSLGLVYHTTHPTGLTYMMVVRYRTPFIRCDNVPSLIIDGPVLILIAAILFVIPNLKLSRISYSLPKKPPQKTQSYSVFKKLFLRSVSHVQFPVGHPFGQRQPTEGLVSVFDVH